MEIMEFSLLKALIIFLVTAIVTFVGASTGGIGMFVIPLFIFLGFPVPMAVATTRVGALASMAGGLIGFSKYKKIDYKIGVKGSLFACVGAYIGSSLLLLIPVDLAKKFISIIMIFLLCFSFLKKKSISINFQISIFKKVIGYFLFFITGCVSGAFGGQGILLVYTLTLFFGMDLITAAGTRAVISLCITVMALIVYFKADTICWSYGVVDAIASLIGTYFGAIYSVKKGEGLIEKIFEIMIVLILIKLLCF